MLNPRMMTAYESGRFYARTALKSNWGALWLTDRYDEFKRGWLDQKRAEAGRAALAAKEEQR